MDYPSLGFCSAEILPSVVGWEFCLVLSEEMLSALSVRNFSWYLVEMPPGVVGNLAAQSSSGLGRFPVGELLGELIGDAITQSALLLGW